MTGGTHTHIYTVTCIHWYFDSYINVTQKARVHIGLVSNILFFDSQQYIHVTLN